MNASVTTTSPAHRWLKVLRPLIWWFLLVLGLYSYRLHERLAARTTVTFQVSLNGQDLYGYEATVKLDGESVTSGEHVSLGSHVLTVSHPKADTLSKEFFVWYGENELGELPLTRSKGTLKIAAQPAAHAITIKGPEFKQTLTNSLGETVTLPTDGYDIEAHYPWSSYRERVVVSDGLTATANFTPRLGSLQLACNQSNVTFRLAGHTARVSTSGQFPIQIELLPEGEYKLTARHLKAEREQTVTVSAGQTNKHPVEFLYGTALIESKPSGVNVRSGDILHGQTPLVLTDQLVGSQEFRLEKNDYEPVEFSVTVTANETNRVEKVLVNLRYKEAMQQARRSLEQKRFESAREFALEALKYEPDDSEATHIEKQSRGLIRLAQAQAFVDRGNFTQAIEEAIASLAIIPEHEPAKVLLAELTRREQARIENERLEKEAQAERERKQREAELAVKQRQDRLKRLTEIYDTANRGYQNAPQFASHELTSTNSASEIGAALNPAFTQKEPTFNILSYEWPATNVFVFKARQRVGIGYREALIVGGQLQAGETRISFKIFESENPPDINLLGLVRLSTSVAVTTQDPQTIKNAQERWKQRILEGIGIVKEKLCDADSRVIKK